MDSSNYVIAFNGVDGKLGIRDIFAPSVQGMKYQRIRYPDGRSTEKGLDLDDYEQVAQFNQIISLVIKSHGFISDENYDSDYDEFSVYVRSRNPVNEKLEVYINDKMWHKFSPMPDKPLKHLEIVVYERWVADGMREIIGGETFPKEKIYDYSEWLDG